MTVRELQARMDAAEFADWMAYDSIESLLPAGDRQVAQLGALFSNYLQHGKGHRFTSQDFLPDWTPHVTRSGFQQPQSPEAIRNAIRRSLGMRPR